MYQNPKCGISAIHLEVYDFSIFDGEQTRVSFGNYNRTMDKDEADEKLGDKESFYAIGYKQSHHNVWERPLSGLRGLYEYEHWQNMKD